MDDKNCCFVRFKYNYNNQEGEDVRVVGNIETLGNWLISDAVQLYKQIRKIYGEQKKK